MYDLLELYARPYSEDEPVICVDEKSKQLLQQSRTPIPAGPGAPIKEDYEYRRAGTRNIFLAVEPKGGHRQAEVTARRTKPDFMQFIVRLVEKVYAGAQKIHLAMLKSEVSAWKHRRNQAQTRIERKFTRQDADHKLSRHYVS